ncbi:hypothetical protein V6N11_077667 [Hibiscus sabdariffa]|uniref:Uncharacterized protein n=1 Tax=Hibiscus sabdariffa TaxID=183260 RepID=A0ABR2TEN5_9ROSI
MASLILLLKALMIRRQNFDLLSNKVEEDNSGHYERNQGSHGCIWNTKCKELEEDDDPITWKIAHHRCVWL